MVYLQPLLMTALLAHAFVIPLPRSDFRQLFHRASVLVGAPKANTSQPDIVEGGAVYYCPWPAEGSAPCKQIPFDTTSK